MGNCGAFLIMGHAGFVTINRILQATEALRNPVHVRRGPRPSVDLWI